MDPCSPDILQKILNERRSDLEAKGVSEQAIAADLAHMKFALSDPAGYAKLMAPKGLNADEKKELDGLLKKVNAGFELGQSKISEILSQGEAERFRVLVYKQSNREGKKPKATNLETAESMIKRYRDAGDEASANRLASLVKKARKRAKANTTKGQDNETLNRLELELDDVNQDIDTILLLINKDQPKAIKKNRRELVQLGKRLERINKKIDSTDDPKRKGALKKQAASIVKKIQSLNEQSRKVVEQFKGTNTTERKALQQLKSRRQELIDKLSKDFGIYRGVSLNSFITDIPSTLEGIVRDLEAVKEDIKFREDVIEEMFKESNTIESALLAKVLGENFVMSRVEKNKSLTRKEVKELLKEWRSLAFEYAGSREKFIADIDYADAESLDELAMSLSDPTTEGIIDETDGNVIIIPNMSLRESLEKSTPGNVPDKNRLGAEDGEVLYRALKSLLSRMETLRRLPQFGKFVDIALIAKIISQIPKIDDVDAAVLFKKAIQWKDSSNSAGDMSYDEILSVTKTLLKELGLDEGVLSSIEFTDPVKWQKTARTFSLDLETYLDKDKNIHTVILTEEGKEKDSSSVRSSSNNAEFTNEELMDLLIEIESKQNQGMALVTYNGNSFDLFAIAQKIGTPEANEMASRIMLRSFDIFQNMRAFQSTTENSTNATSQMYSLGNVAAAVGVSEFKTESNYMPPLLKKRSLNQTVTIEDLSAIPDEAMPMEDKEIIVNDINKVKPHQALERLEAYSMADGALNIQVFRALQAKAGSSVRVRHANRNVYAVTIGDLVPTWASVTQQSPTYNGIAESVSKWTISASGRTMATAFDGLLVQEENSTTVIDLDKAQPIVMALMATSLRFAPNTEAFGKVLSKVIEEGLTPEQQTYMTAIRTSKLNAEAAKEINKQTYRDNGSRLPIGIIGADKNGLIPGIEFAEGTEKDQRNQYINAIIDGFKEQLGRSYQDVLIELAETEDFKPQESTNKEDDYILQFIISTIKKYSDMKDFDIIDFGNGNIDYAIGTSLGRGIAQILTNARQGFKPSLNSQAIQATSPKTARHLLSAGGRPDTKIHQSLIYRAPTVGEVNYIFPRVFSEVESAFIDYRLRQRIQHILNSDIEDPEAVINAYKNLIEDPDEVLTDRRPDLLSMGLTANVNNRALMNKLPTLENLRARTIEALLDMPELLVLWQHDSMTYAPGSKIFLDENTKQRMFSEDALSPGSLSATSVLAGMGPLFAHVKTYPFLGEDILYKSLERGIKAYKKGAKFSKSNYFDFDMNGAHHMAALTLMYLDTDGSKLDEILGNIGLQDVAKDRYQEAVTLLSQSLDSIEKMYISQRDSNGAEQARRLKKFLNESPVESRDGFKRAVIARLYSGGLKAVRESIEDWMSESRPAGLTGVDADFIAQHLMGSKAYLQLNILDEALGGVTKEQREQLANAIASELRDVYQGDWTQNLRQKAIENGFTIAGERMFSLNFLHEAIETRIKFIAELRQLPIEEVRAEYQERIDNATEFVSGLSTTEDGKRQNVKLTDEQARQLDVILMGKEEYYKTTPSLIALNALQRVPYRLRGTENDGMRGRIQEHSSILGRRIEESDTLGFENFNVYFTMGFDSSGGRGYFVGHKFQPINSELSSVERENTPDNKDDQKYSMWGFNKNNLGKLSRDKAEAEIAKLMARHIALQLSPRYAPKFGNYNMDQSETREGFMREWFERSNREDQAYVSYLRNEPNLTDEITDLRKSNGGLLKNSLRFLIDPSRTRTSALDVEYNPGSEKSIKGLGGFRPEYAAIPWQERGILSLQQMYYNKLIQDDKAEKTARLRKEVSSVNDVIPSEARGYVNRYQNSKAPYVYATPIDNIYEMTVGNTSRRLELRANSLQYVLEKFGMTHGHQDLVEEQNWAKLFTIWKISNVAINPYIRNMAKLKGKRGSIQEREDYTIAQSHALNMYQALTQLWSFHDGVSGESRSYLEFGKMIGIEGKELQDKHYIDMLFYFAKRGINALKPLTLGLEPTNNIVASGEPSSDERSTRVSTLTVQSVDALQMIYNVVYDVVGREIATEYMRKIDPENFKSLEKDGNGFVLLSSVPLEHQQAVFREIFTSDRTKRRGEFDLYLFINEATQEVQIGNRIDFDNAKNPKSRGRDGGMPRFDTSRTDGNTIYKLTPEDLQNMFTQLQNQVMLYNTELATALGTNIGMVDNENMVFMNAERRRFYEAQRMAYADEMDILSILHSRSESPLRTTSNIQMQGDFGLPVVVYDAGYYIAGKDGDPRGTAFNRAWQGKISRAIETARMYRLDEEATRLENLLTSDNAYLIPAVVIMSQAEGSELRKRRLRSYVGSAMPEKTFDKIYNEASLYVNDYLSAITRDVPRNKYSHQAKRFVELNGPVEVLNVSPKILKEIGVEDTTSREEIVLAKQALENANRQYTEEGGILLTNDNVLTLSEDDGLTDAFQSDGQQMEVAISKLVEENAITEETAELYRGMFGIILTHNKEFANNLSIILDPDLERAGLSQRYGDRFVIKLNPKLLKRRAVPEALEVMAHELAHIARLRHLETDSDVYRSFIAAFKTRDGKEAITDMVTSMYAGDKGEINALLDHYTENAEEFIAEWGAFVLISRTINNKTIIDRINKLREKYEVVDEATSWWERAFNRIKRIASSITQRMQVFRQSNRKAMAYMDNLVEVMFNFGNTYSTSRAAVDNVSGTFGTPLIELERGTSITEAEDIVMLLQKYNIVEELESKAEVLTEEEQATLINYKEDISRLPKNTILGQDTQEYIKTINNLVQYGSETGSIEISRGALNKEEEIALATFVLERIIKIRGVRADNLSVISRLVRDMPKATRVRNWIVESFLTGTARKVGEKGRYGGGFGGGTSANLTYASAESILVALGFIMNTVKGGGIFSERVGGILQDKNYIEQWSRPVVLLAERIKNSYSQQEAQLIRSAAFYYLLLEKPSDRSQMPIGEELTDGMFNEAKRYAEAYEKNISNFVDLAVEYETYSPNFMSPKDMIALRVNNTFFEKNSEGAGRFEEALSKLYTQKIEKNMRDEGIADPYSLYLSGGMFGITGADQRNSPIEEFYNVLQANPNQLNEAQRLILDEIENYAFNLFKEKNPTSTVTLNQFKYRLKGSTEGSNWQSTKEFLLESARRMLRRAKAGESYKNIFRSLTTNQRTIIIKYLRESLNNENSSTSRQREDIVRGRLQDIFHGSTKPPKYFQSNVIGKTNSPIRLRVLKLINTQGHSTVMPNTQALDITAKDIFIEANNLSVAERAILRNGFSTDLKSIIVGMERTMARSAYNRKAIQDLSGVKGVSFASLIKAIKAAKSDSDWDAVLDEVQRKHDLTIGAATRINETQGSGVENLGLRTADFLTTALWGPNRNIAALLNEGTLSAVVTQMFGGNPLLFMKDVVSGILPLLVNVVSRRGGNTLLNNSIYTSVPQALFDIDTATRGFYEHQLVTKDEEESVGELDENGFKPSKPSRVVGLLGGFWKRMKDSHLIAEPALRASVMRQAQIALIRRINKLEKYLDFIESYEGPRNPEMYERLVAEVGSDRNLDLFGSEKLIVQYMHESGLLDRKIIKALKYIVTELNGIAKTGILGIEYFDITKIQNAIEENITSRLFDEMPNSGGLKKNDLYEALNSVSKFQVSMMRQSITEGNTMDRPTEGRPILAFIHLYRSFPKLFVTQHALESYGRTTPQILFMKVLTSFIMDVIYNFILLWAVGVITKDDLERMQREGPNIKDYTILATIIARNPFFSTRMLPSTMLSLLIIAGGKTVGGEKISTYDMLGVSLPPAAAAIVSGLMKSMQIGQDAINRDGEFSTGATVDFAARFVPLLDPILRYVIATAIDPKFAEKRNKSSRARNTSPINMGNTLMDREIQTERSLLRDLLNEAFPTGMQNISKPLPSFIQPEMPSIPFEAPQAIETPPSTQMPTEGISEPPVERTEPREQTQMDSDRATSPATPPTNLTGES